MRKAKIIAAAVAAGLFVASVSRADPFDPKTIPAEAKWVVHIDLDAARPTKSFAVLRDTLLANDNVSAKLDQIKQITGLTIPDDVADITLYGKAAGDDAGVVILHGKLDKAKTLDSLRNADQFNTKAYRTYDVYTWLDKDKNQTMFGAFHDDSTVIIGHTEANIDSTLDAMDGKADSLKADSPLAAGIKPQTLMYLAAKDISSLHAPEAKPNPIAASVESATICLTEKGDTLTAQGELHTASSDSAGNVQSLLEGVKGMIGVAASGDNADPVAKAVVAADKSFTATRTEKTVAVEWPISIDQFSTIIKAMADKQAAKN